MLHYLLILIGAIIRLLPHWPNFTPIGALALFGGTKIKNKFAAIIVPVLTMALTDFYLGFHQLIIFTWGSMALVALLGFWVRQRYGFWRVAIGTIVGSFLFFLITNFGVYLMGWYGYGLGGLTKTYIMAIPFYRNSILGDVFYSAVFFGGYELVYYFFRRYQDSKLAKQTITLR